jgi:3D (Asp-Asp-Asp) domain-containing protein
VEQTGVEYFDFWEKPSCWFPPFTPILALAHRFMIPLKLPILLSVALLPLLASCGSGIQTLSHQDIHRHGPYAIDRNYNVIPMPTSTLLAEAAGKPRDKHKMPIYKFSDRQRVVRTTAYTCSEADHIQYGSKNAAGTNLRFSNKVRSAAADWSFYPVGTVFRVKGMPQLFVVDDYGSALTGTGTIDMYKPSRAMMNQWGRRNVEITVVQWGSFERSAEILSHRTKHAHCRQMLANITRQRPDLNRVAIR